MIFRNDRYGSPISQLGFGCMRFTKKGGRIDYDKAEKEILLALEGGVNYLDTAYIYGGSEELLGKVITRNNLRDKVKIATKLPQYLVRSAKAVDRYFDEELKRLQTDYIDYYLMHMFTDMSEWERLCAYGIKEWIADKKEKGIIRNIGFSFHGDTETFLKILNCYDWDFCQIQYNYLDEHSQAGRKGLEAAGEKGIPVIIMEPLRGGKLVRLPAKALKLLEESGTGYSAAELGLRWLWDQPQVTCVLSGMNSSEMVSENVRIASEAEPGHFKDADRELTEKVKEIIKEKEKVGCTGCRYCMPCPKGVDIPAIFLYYNLMYLDKKKPVRYEFMRNFGLKKDAGFASRCIGCGACEKHCPQRIPIREMLKEADRDLQPLPYRIALKAARKFMGR